MPLLAFRPVLLIVLCTTVVGCGQKGPLYIPDATGTVVTRPTQTPSAPSQGESAPAQDDTTLEKPPLPNPPPR